MLGCSVETVPVYLPNAREDDYTLVTEGLEAGLEVTPVFVDRRYGAIVLTLRDECVATPQGNLCGEAPWKNLSCSTRVGWAGRTPKRVAHEVGHMLGLGHSLDPDNTMSRDPDGLGILPGQRETLIKQVARVNACWPR